MWSKSPSSQSRASRNARQCQSVFRFAPHRQPQTRRAESLRCTPLHVYVGPRRSGQSLPPVTSPQVYAESAEPFGLVRLQPAPPPLTAATALRRPDSPVRRSEQLCIIPRIVPEPEGASSIASASVRPAPAAAYGLAPYAICVRLQPRLSPSLHPVPNSIGHLMNARFSLGAKFNVITRPKGIAEDI